jgi:phytoene desaturase
VADDDVLIIGAGLAGLATGSFGQMNGYRTHIVEHHTEPGGVATAWPNQGYLVDGGIHYLMGYRPGSACHDLYREVGILQEREYPELSTFVHFTDQRGGSGLSFQADLDRLARDLKTLAPADAVIIDQLLAGARAMQRTDVFAMRVHDPEVLGWAGIVKQVWGLRRVLRYFSPRFDQPMSAYLQDVQSQPLRDMLQNFFLPEVPVWFVMLLLGLLANRQLALLPKSCNDLVAGMVNRYEGLGGRITYGATVAEILVEQDRAVGVRLQDGRTLRAGTVVSTADAHATIFSLLGGRYVDGAVRERFETWKLLPPIVTLSFGVRRSFPDEPPLQFILLRSPLTIAGATLTGFPLRLFNYSPHFAPSGCTVVQPLLHTDWSYWNELQPDRAGYEAAKRTFADTMLEILEERFPGIAEQVEMTDVATPYTTWRYTRNREGAFMGWHPTPKNMRARVSKSLPGLSHFYMAGQWMAPGGGVPPCLFSGRHVVQQVCRRDGRRFTTTHA